MRSLGISIHDSAGMARLQSAYDARMPAESEECQCRDCRNWSGGVCRITREDEDGNECVEEWKTDRYDTCDDVNPKESEY